MASLRPYAGYYANPARAPQVVSPPYDALTPQERHAYASAHPGNFLNVMRSLEEFPPAERPRIDALLAANRARLQRMIDARDLIPMPDPAMFLYRMAHHDHAQTGVVAEVPVSEYENGAIRKHEKTQQSKEDDLVNYLDAVGASTSPICLAYPAQAAIDAEVARLVAREPLLDFGADDGVRQTVWRIDDAGDIARLAGLFESVPTTYLTDGHHRAAAAARVAAERRGGKARPTGEEPYNFLLTALFPHDQLRILEYNRCVAGDGVSVDAVLSGVEQGFAVQRLDPGDAAQARPRARGEFGMFLDGHWYRLAAKEVAIDPDDPVASLDVTLLQQRVFEAVLGIMDPRADPRLRYLSAAVELWELEQACRERNEIGFALYPTSIADLMAVADAGETMPPKSTWFDPKMRSGLFVRLR